MLKEICEYIARNDRNSDIMDCYEEYQDGAMDQNTLFEILQNVLGSWKQDIILNGEMNGVVLEYYKWLGIDGDD